MKNNLYDTIADRWIHGGTVFFYSDPHFGDAELNPNRKGYPGDDEQVKRINSVVGKNDTIVFLGDIGDVNYIKHIRGHKVLVTGNHDTGVTNYKRLKYECADLDNFTEECLDYYLNELTGFYKSRDKLCYDDHLFDEVYEGCLFISDKIVLSHEPIEIPFALNIHGHSHNIHNGYEDKNHINVCAEHINYTPVPISTIIKSGALNKIPQIHRITIDKASEKYQR